MSQKIENLLNLALEIPEELRNRTQDLNVGFDSLTRTWELIVKYHGDLSALSSIGVTVEELLPGYAILTVPEQLVEAVADLPEIEYVEKPKRYYFNNDPCTCTKTDAHDCIKDRLSACVGGTLGTETCIDPVTLRSPHLAGEGVLIAVLDSGIDYRLADFRTAEGETRIQYLWDQTLIPDATSTPPQIPPEGFALGVEFDAAQINAALQTGSALTVPSIDSSGHGTAVAGLAAGSAPGHEGVAPASELLIVKLGVPDTQGFPRTTELMRGVTYALRKASALNRPLVINLSFGNSYGSHDGTSLLERFLDNAAEIGRTVICVGAGNEGSAAGHVMGNTADTPAIDLSVGSYEPSLNLQLWKHYGDAFLITLRSPGGHSMQLPAYTTARQYSFLLEQTRILVYLGEPTPYSANQEIYLELLPETSSDNGRKTAYIRSGIWQLSVQGADGRNGCYDLYLPVSSARSIGTAFLKPTPRTTLTIPSTAAGVITVAAYDSVYDAAADFSGRGFAYSALNFSANSSAVPLSAVSLSPFPIKPDLAAPGVNLPAPDLYGGYTPVTGTSFATPIVSGSAALLMEWGIVRGNDPWLYGEKIRAWLRKGARPIRGENQYPNDRVGFGALCLSGSFPEH